MTTRKHALRDIAIVAAHELADALRSRRVVIMALLFVGGAVAGTLVFVSLLKSIEAALAHALMVTSAGKPGAVTAELMRSERFINTLSDLVGDDTLARQLAGLPPLALFYGWLGMTFLPAVIMLTSAETISAEMASGSLRFSLLRTGRLDFSVGKLLGQTLLVVAAIACGALTVWITGLLSLASFEAGRSALWLALLSLRIACYGFTYVGIAVGISHLTRSAPLSRALALLSLLGFSLLSNLVQHVRAVRSYAPDLADALLQLVPSTHTIDLWQPSLLERLPAMLMLVALGVGYFALGYAVRARRDV